MLLLVLVCVVAAIHDESGHYINEFVIETKGGSQQAKQIAKETGHDYMEAVSQVGS